MATDGNLSADGRHLSLVSKDIEQLENLKECFKIRAKIGNHTSFSSRAGANPCYDVQWGDVRLYEFLADIGLMPRKSLTLGALRIPDEFFFDFLRGAFDGDGSFYSYFDPRWKSSFMFYLAFTSAGATHIEWLRASIRRFTGCAGHVSRTPPNGNRHEISNLRYAKRESLPILRAMYAHPGALHLSRKRLKIEAALRIVGKSLAESPSILTK